LFLLVAETGMKWALGILVYVRHRKGYFCFWKGIYYIL
jgi:hypothetical protein